MIVLLEGEADMTSKMPDYEKAFDFVFKPVEAI